MMLAMSEVWPRDFSPFAGFLQGSQFPALEGGFAQP